MGTSFRSGFESASKSIFIPNCFNVDCCCCWELVSRWGLVETVSNRVVTIVPNQFVLYTGEWSNTTSLIITNTGEVPLYSVWVETWSDIPTVMSKVSFNVDKNPESIKARIGDSGRYMEFDHDFFVLRMIKTDHGESLLLRFYELLPNKARRITLSGQAKVTSKGFAQVLKDFKYEPELLLKK
jgi:hypothetical protein